MLLSRSAAPWLDVGVAKVGVIFGLGFVVGVFDLRLQCIAVEMKLWLRRWIGLSEIS